MKNPFPIPPYYTITIYNQEDQSWVSRHLRGEESEEQRERVQTGEGEQQAGHLIAQDKKGEQCQCQSVRERGVTLKMIILYIYHIFSLTFLI